MSDPLHQFEIHKLIPLSFLGEDISFTNASLFMVLSVVLATLFLWGGIARSKVIPGPWQSMTEMVYGFVSNMLDETMGIKGRPYFSFIFTVFLFIFMGNMIGMIPYTYTFTSQIIVTFTLAMIVFFAASLVGFWHHGLHYLTLFVPQGTPIFMLPIIVPIEILSYLSRPVSLAIRLFANMMAGHTMLKVFAGFTIALGIFGIGPLFINVLLTAFEILVAVLQAYVFTILTCIYFQQAIHLH